MFHVVVRRAVARRRGTLRAMPDKDPADDGPSLELPSFGFGRKKRRDRAEDSHPEVPATPDPGPEATPGSAPEVPASPDPGPEVVPGAAPEVPTPDPDVSPGAPPEIDPLTPARPDQPAPRPEIEPTGPVAPEPEPAAPEIDPLVPTRPEHEPTPPPPPPPAEREAGTSRARGPVRLPSLPALPALPAVLLVGAVVGLVAVLLTWGSLRLCDAATGTASCGGGPGLLLLLAILIALTYLGGWLLRGFDIDDAGSTSLLAVGLLAVVAMLFLVDSLDEWSGVVAVPVVTIAAYALSWRVTATLVEAGRA
jgi:hypothetical protein